MAKLNSLDKSNMRQVILDFPKQFRIGLEAAKHIKPATSNPRPSADAASGLARRDALGLGQQPATTVIICGMGGSALPGELLKLFNANHLKSKVRINIHRDYGLPYYASSQSIVICISYSGNTEEALSAYQEALKKNLTVASIASGGKLVELCKKNKTPIAIIPSNIEPRNAIAYQFAALIKILANAKLIKNIDKNLLALEKNLKPKLLEKHGKNLAKKLAGKTPVIYASRKNKALTYLWKIKFNETAKTLAIANHFPELNHNEMNGFIKPAGKFYVIILSDSDEQPRIAKRIKLTAKIISDLGTEVEWVKISGKDIFEKVFSNSLIGDWVAYHLALEYGIDPTPVELVERLKKELK